MNSLKKKHFPLNFWSINKEDIICLSINFIFLIIIFIYFYFTNSFFNIFIYEDSAPYIILSKKYLQDIPQYIKKFIPIPNILSFIFNFLLKIFGKNAIYSQLLYILLNNLLSIYLFNILLKIYDLVKNPLWSTILFNFFPFHFLVFRISPTNDLLFFNLICISLILFRLDLDRKSVV